MKIPKILPEVSDRTKFNICLGIAAVGLLGAFLQVDSLAAFDDEFGPVCDECPVSKNEDEAVEDIAE